MSIPFSLLSLIGMIIGQVQIENTAYVESKVVTTLSQLIRFNMIKNKRHKSETVSNIRHSKDQETPFPLYLGLLIYSKSREKSIISKLAIHGLSVSYDRIQQVQLSVTKQLCKKYNDTGVVYPPGLVHGLFTSAATHNIDHNPSINTAKSSFHGASISIFQHPDSEIEIPQANFKSDFNDEQQLSLPDYYTNLPPTTNISTQYPIQTANLVEIQSVQDKLTQWLHQVTRLCSDEFIDINERLSFSGFHSRTQVKQVIKGLSVLMPLLRDNINSLSMVRHCMDVIIKVINQVHPSQVAIITADQPVYALGKRIQWMYPEEYGESKIIMSMGCLYRDGIVECNWRLGRW